MSTRESMMDPELADGPLLSAGGVDARAFDPLVERLKTAMRGDGTITVQDDLERDRLLADYRRQFTEQVVHDLSFNLQRLWHWANEIDSSRARAPAVLSDGQIQDGFGRLSKLRRYLVDNDAWCGSRAELSCGLAFRQFYCDALALGDRLWRLERGFRLRRRPPEKLRRTEIPGAGSYDFFQALVSAVEIGMPNILTVRPLRGLLPAATYQLTRLAFPWPPFRYAKWIEGVRYILTSGAFGNIKAPSGTNVVSRSVEEFYADPHFIDQATGKTRHNIILALSHRHPTFDIALLAEVFNGRDHGIWGNARYFPRSAASDPRLVLVEQAGRKSMERALAKSHDILSNQRMPLLIIVDGTIPYPCYGQQMRIKRGIRLLLEYMRTRSNGSGRQTYVVPFSLDDPVSFLSGLDSGIRATFHCPIRMNDIAPVPSQADSGQVNWGDPLLNHLECVFLANTGQVRHGWRTPSVIETVRRTREILSSDPTRRGRIRRRFHPSLCDLSRTPLA